MTRKETAQVMGVLAVAYPNFYKDPSYREPALSLWSELLADDDARIVGAAVKTYIATDTTGFPPSIGQIRQIMTGMTTKVENGSDAWVLVKNAISRSTYYSKEEFDRLPKPVQRAVGSHTQLKEWASMDMNTLNAVVAPSFRKAYAQVESDEKMQNALPADIKQVLGFTETLKIGE